MWKINPSKPTLLILFLVMAGIGLTIGAASALMVFTESLEINDNGGGDSEVEITSGTGSSKLTLTTQGNKEFAIINQAPLKKVTCGPGTILKNGKCVVDSTCGPGTIRKNGVCVVDSSQNIGGGGCLIATATFGTELAPQVQQLRELRDSTLLQTNSGSSFMIGFNQIYYSFSPTIADLERQNPVFKEAVKLTITPLLTSLSILNYVDVDSNEEVLGYGIGIILLNVGMYFVAPSIAIMMLKRKLS